MCGQEGTYHGAAGIPLTIRRRICMSENGFSIKADSSTKSRVEKIAEAIFVCTAFLAVIAVASISIYLVIKGAPAFWEVGPLEILFGTKWAPTAQDPSYGIAYIILTSIVGTGLAILIGVPIGVLTAVFIAELSNKKAARIVQPAVELLAGIPSVVYGLLGILILNPLMYDLEKMIFKGSTTHRYTGGSNLLSAVLVLAIMILPTVINTSESALRAVPKEYRNASLALGATKIQTIFKTTIPAAKSGIITGIVLGIGRAVGEAMAISLVAGSAVNFPLPFNAVRFLTTAIVSEMGYAEVGSIHQNVLFTIGLVLFVFIMIINIVLSGILKKGGERNE